MTDFGKTPVLVTNSRALPTRDVWDTWIIVVTFVTVILLDGWVGCEPSHSPAAGR